MLLDIEMEYYKKSLTIKFEEQHGTYLILMAELSLGGHGKKYNYSRHLMGYLITAVYMRQI